MFASSAILAAAGLAAAAWVPATPAALALQRAVDRAAALGSPALGLPAGEVVFNDASFNISRAMSLTLAGAGSGRATTLVFRPGVGVRIENCSDLVLRDITVDYNPLPYVHGAVLTGSSAAPLSIQLDPASLTFEDLVASYPPHDTWPPVTAFHKGTTDYKRGVGSWGRPPSFKPVEGSPGRYTLGYSVTGLVAGDTITAATRTGFTVTLSYTTRVALENVVIHAAGNMAITEFQGGGGNTYTNVSLVPRSADRPLASNADGFHSSGMRLGPTLSGVTMKNLLDDYFNVHNTFQLVAKRTGPASVLVGDYQYLAGGNTLYATQQTLSRVRPGESASFFVINALADALGNGIHNIIASIERVTDPTLLPLLASAHAAAAKMAKDTPCSACKAGLNSFAAAQLYNVTFAEPLPTVVAALDFFNADNISNTGAVIQDSSFTGSCSNLGRFKSSGGAIRRNTWHRGPTSQNLEIEPLQNWLEGMAGIHDVTISGNVFYGTAVSPVHVFGAVRIEQANNTYIH